jgi:hypothetical protein
MGTRCAWERPRILSTACNNPTFQEGDKVSQYVFYVSKDGEPLQLNMLGVNYLTGSHFDE